MSNGTDSSAVVTRVRYRERQPLRASDLTDEQSYLIAMRRRHNIGPHTWGIARGLNLTMRARDLIVSPGLAIDGYGRELIVPDPLLVPENVLLNLQVNVLDVWLLYGLEAANPEHLGRWECGPNLYGRTDEVASVSITAATNGVDPRAPTELPPEDLNFSPDRTPVDDPTQQWPVYLGRLNRTDPNSSFTLPATDLARVVLVGGVIDAPSGLARMQVDGEIPEHPARFVVSTADGGGTLGERLAIDRAGLVAINGHASVNNNLHISDAPVDESWGVGFASASPPPSAAMPWQIYRAAVPVQNGSPIQQLRVEMGGPVGKADPKGFLTMVRYAQGADFNSGLSISADSTVRVSGKLKVQGQLIEGSIPADASDPRFRGAVINSWASGITAGAQAPLTATLAVKIGDLDQNVANTPVKYSITVANQGPGDLTNVHVYELLALDGQTVQPATDLDASGFGLTVSGSRVFARTYTAGSPGEFDVAISVIAVVPTGLTTQSQARKTFNIVSPLGG